VIVYYAALSLDGRIAGLDHDLAFLKTLEGGPERDYENFIAGVDSLIMGAGTWDFLVRHGSWQPLCFDMSR
jgi:dihydrofolate reductase